MMSTTSQSTYRSPRSKIGRLLLTSRIAKVGEILGVFLVGLLLIQLLLPLAGDNIIVQQAIVWVANVVMLLLVWWGIRVRGQHWSDIGLTFRQITLKESFRIFLQSLLVFVMAMAAFVLGSIIMANITGIPESADMSNYSYLQDNLFMLILTLIGVYIVSSFGEEIIYRAFLINRLRELGLATKTGTVLAVVLSAIVFGLIHYEWGPMGVVQTGFMGLVLGVCYLKFNHGLWVVILAHAYMDTILMVQMYLAG